MKISSTGVDVGGKSDAIIIVALLAGVGLILWKSGIFGVASGAAKVADTALGAVNTAVNAASTVVTDAVNLPENAVTLATLLPQLPLAIEQAVSKPLTVQSIFDAAIQGKIATFPGSSSISQKTANMIDSVYHMYPGVTATNWSQIAIANGAVFNAQGFIVSDNTHQAPD